MQENRGVQEEEMEALLSIYGEEECSIVPSDYYCEVQVKPPAGLMQGGPNAFCLLRLCVYFPESYPSLSHPVAELSAPWLYEDMRKRLVDSLVKIYQESVGEVVVFRWVEWLKDQGWMWKEAHVWMQKHIPPVADNHKTMVIASSYPMPQESQLDGKVEGTGLMRDEKSLEELDQVLGIVHGVPFTEKKSTFQGHLAPVTSVEQVETVMDALLRNRKFAGATHNIMAYRIAVPEKNTVLQDSDDDGENAAGGRLLHLLQIVDALNVVVVVSRWFGGVLLGPDRFKHINNAARSTLAAYGYIEGSRPSVSSTQKTSAKSNSQKGKKR